MGGERFQYPSEAADRELPVKHLGRGVSLDSLTPDVITVRARRALKDNPGGFVGRLSRDELGALVPQFSVLECGFAPGVQAQIESVNGEHLLRLTGNGMRFGRPLKGEINILLANHPQRQALHVIEHSGVPLLLRPMLPKMDAMLRAGMSRIVGESVGGFQIGDGYVSAVVGFKEAPTQPIQRRAA